jgi:hypothetical protein
VKIALTALLACVPVALWGQTAVGPASAPDTTTATDTTRAVDSTAAPSSFGVLQISVDAESVEVVVDGLPRGSAPLQVDSLDPGSHVVRLVPPDPSSWLVAATTDTVFVPAGITTTRRFTMHRWYSVASIPAGVPVSTDDSLAGTTPLLLSSERLTRATRIAIGGGRFRPATATLDDFVRGTLLVRLEPVSPDDMPQVLAATELLPEPPSSTGLVISGIASVAFGVAAAYFKGGADRAADQYLVTRDPSLLQERDRMDNGAALAVVGMQVSLGLFMYFLLSR